jgi:D-alanine-D-alanine ligase
LGNLFEILNVALIIGGLSAEREVSLASGKGILSALRELGHNVRVIDPIYGDKEVSEEVIFKDMVSRDCPTLEKLESIKETSYRNVLTCINSKLFDDIDIAFIGLHGKFGEDGRIQVLLEMRNIKYTGSDVFSSAITLDKDISKIIFKRNGVKTPEWLTLFDKLNDVNDVRNKINDSVGFPCVIKPNDEGSTVGLTIAQPEITNEKLTKAIDFAFSYSDKVIIEQYIKGRELTVPVIGDEAYPVIEIKPKDGFYDYLHKYTKGMTEYVCPAELDSEMEKHATEVALNAHNSLQCSVYSRVDFILSDKNELHCLEVNTLPGMTETSLVPKSAKVLNISFAELIDKIIQISLNSK